MALHWDGFAGWEQMGPDDLSPPGVDGPRTMYGVFEKYEHGYDLWVWSGPEEHVLGAMGADLRGMNRAKNIGTFHTMAEARKAAEAFHSTGEMGPTTFDIIAALELGPRYRFADWPNHDIEPGRAGVYTVWEGDQFIYVGMAGRTMGVDPEKLPGKDSPTLKPSNPLVSRLGAHAAGRRSGDQFCVYVCDRFIVPFLGPDALQELAEGDLKLDLSTKHHIRTYYDYRYITDLGPYTALLLERLIQGGALAAGKPFLNPR
jgi:hypothetical protein